MTNNYVHHLCIQTNTYSESVLFYTKALNFEIVEESPNFHGRAFNTWLKLGAFYIELQTGKKGLGCIASMPFLRINNLFIQKGISKKGISGKIKWWSKFKNRKERGYMGRKKKTLPKNFDELIEAGDISTLIEVFTQCELDARGGYSKSTALSFRHIPNELIRWLVEQGADINARDNYGRTPLHNHAISWCGNTELLLDLGADIEAVDYQNETPLFAAAGSFKPNVVQTLVSRGANFNAKNKMKQTPLEKALVMCKNIDIVNVVGVADILLDAGTTVTKGMKDSIKRIGNEFEFHKEGFNKEYLIQTDEALYRLYELFDVFPVGKRKIHDGTSPITISSKGWPSQHHELWSLLIPSKGHAKTIQGEVIRITGKVSYEILENGGINWDNQFRLMLNSLNHYFSLGTPLQPAVLQEVAILTKEFQNGNGNDEPARLCELAVQWVLSNPNPIAMDQPVYRR